MEHRKQQKFLFLLFSLLPALASGMKKVNCTLMTDTSEDTKNLQIHNLDESDLVMKDVLHTCPNTNIQIPQVAEYQHHRIEDLCKASNQQKVHE